MRFHSLLSFAATAAAASITLPVNYTATVDVGTLSFYYPSSFKSSPLLLVPDNGATGGLDVFSTPSAKKYGTTRTGGRTKLSEVVYGTGYEYGVTVSTELSSLMLFPLSSPTTWDTVKPSKKLWGDWGATCAWGSYIWVFGKKEDLVLHVSSSEGVQEVLRFPNPAGRDEISACAISSDGETAWAGSSVGVVYKIKWKVGSTKTPKVSVAADLGEEVVGLAVYETKDDDDSVVLVAHEDKVEVYAQENFNASLASIGLEGEYEIKDVALHQPSSTIAFTLEADDSEGFGLANLSPLFSAVPGIKKNTKFTPRLDEDDGEEVALHSECSNRGLFSSKACVCLTGWTGTDCSKPSCNPSCKNGGICTGNNVCRCPSTHSGPDCTFALLPALHETDATGADGDDPAIWLHPTNPSQSRIITTTKSTSGAGLNAFTLNGTKTGFIAAKEPNNVDVLYGFPLGPGNKTVDLAYAACRDDNTLCLFTITASGDLEAVAGGVQNTLPKDYHVYGSCAYQDPKSKEFYLFVNAKTAEYLQYHLTASENGTLHTELVRKFKGGSGGQTEGCVVDADSQSIFVGEEPYGLWRFEAHPNSTADGVLVDSVDGNLWADVEGVTITGDVIIVSIQGVSAYNVYDLAAPHKFRGTFTIGQSKDGGIDGVTNTDGVAGMAEDFGVPGLERGIVVVHDDVNRLPDGKASEEASFKIIGLGAVIDGVGL